MDSKSVLDIFKEITRIPRESGHEEAISAWLLDWASRRGFEAKQDAAGNVLIAKPASKGKEDVPTLVLQAHQDMVCEKNEGVSHDFASDPINYTVEDGWMIAKDTTLGADDGIGIAACLALLGSDVPSGPIECVFTRSEETGMDGAFGMEPGFFSGKTLINLDSEDEGQMFIGCAGGITTEASFCYETEPQRPGTSRVRLKLSGAQGGHSGDDIGKNRINTVQEMARFLNPYVTDGRVQLIKIDGGGKHNAIARECTAVVAVADADSFCAEFKAFGAILKEEHHRSDSAICAEAAVKTDCKCGRLPVAKADAVRIVGALFACPHGVVAMSEDIPGFVETSTNLASVHMDQGTAEVVTSQRSSIVSECDMIAAKVRACFELAGAKVEHSAGYPGWKPNPDSGILKVCVESYERLFGEKPLVLAIHAGLECGLFLEKFPGLDMISFGPTLRGVHAPGERMELASLDKFVAHLEDVVKSFK